jgi:hypothetical protein
MNNVALNLLQKKQKNCFNFSLAICACLSLYIAAGVAAVYAADAAAPPEAGEQTQTDEAVTAPPPLPSEARESDDSRNIPQPEVNIIQRKDMRIEEYRVNGRLRYVKITPKKGKPYYLVDKDGDGDLETRHDDLDGVPPVNEWILLEW